MTIKDQGAPSARLQPENLLWEARHAMRWALEDDADERLRGLRASTIGKLSQSIAAIDAVLSGRDVEDALKALSWEIP